MLSVIVRMVLRVAGAIGLALIALFIFVPRELHAAPTLHLRMDDQSERIAEYITSYRGDVTASPKPYPVPTQDTIFILKQNPAKPDDYAFIIHAWPDDKSVQDLALYHLQVKTPISPSGDILQPIIEANEILRQTAKKIDYAVPTPSEEELGGYRIVAFDAGGVPIASTTAWFYIDNIQFESLTIVNTCDGLKASPYPLPTDIRSQLFTAYHYYEAPSLYQDSWLEASQPVSKNYFKAYRWTATNGLRLPVDDAELLVVDDPPPYRAASYSLRVENVFGRYMNVATEEEVLPVATVVEPRVARAEYPYQEPLVYKPLGDKPRGEAPFYAQLTASGVKNADRIEWLIRNDKRAVREGQKDTLFTETLTGSLERLIYPDHEIFTAGDYLLRITATNTRSGCTYEEELKLKVDSSILKKEAIPNVFSPNGDGINDLFCLIEPTQNCRSIRTFRVNILNHLGRQVYEYDGDPLEWEGWNGKKKGKGKTLNPGVYFYIIQATGYDGNSFRGGEYKGPLHLFK
ncbi:MAG: hypothetical protein CSA97_04370 [Bacteroidetes bacterium]|nr:MAG: hypothetical protein CSA97_04370 [Bacteroidota bacterium]